MALTGALQADFSGFVSEANKASAALGVMEGEAKKTGTTLTKVDDGLGKVGGSANQMLGTLQSVAGAFGIAFSVDAVIGFGKEILQTADDLTRLSQQTGMSVEQIQRLGYTAEQSGNTLDQMTEAASKLQVALNTEKGQKAIEALGLEFRSFAAAKPYDQLLQVSDALRGISDPAERAQRAVELFGESGAKILPTLASDMRAVGEAATVASNEQIDALAAAGDAIDRWGQTAKTTTVGAVGALLLAGEQVANQGLLKTIEVWVKSGTPEEFLKQMTAISIAAKDLGSKLTAAQLAEIEAQGGFGPAPGETPRERAERDRTEAAAKREHEQAAKALAAAEAELKNVRLGYGGNLASMSAETLKAVQADLQLGASQGTVATAYGLTAQQVKAASDQLKTQITVVTGLGTEWANVGTKVDMSVDHILTKIAEAETSMQEFEAETQRQVQAYIDMQYGAEAAAQGIDATTTATERLSVAMSSATHQTSSLFEKLQAGKALFESYQAAGVATGSQIGLDPYNFRQQQKTLLPTMGSTGNTLNVNVNSTEAGDVANKLVSEMQRRGMRF